MFSWKFFIPLQRGSNQHRRGLTVGDVHLSTFTFYTITILFPTEALTVILRINVSLSETEISKHETNR